MTHLATQEHFDDVRRYVQTETGVHTPLGPVQVMGWVDDDGEVIGGWMFERYTGVTGSVHAHWAGPTDKNWLTRGMLSLVAIYLFDQLKVSVIYAEVRGSDSYVRKLDERLGFVQQATLPAYFPDDELVIYSMTKQQCRFLPKEYKETFDG